MGIHNNYNNDPHNDNSMEMKFQNNIIILKRVRSLKYLKRTEKEWVRLCYKEAILRGFSIVNQIQCYIASKTKIWIERSGIEYLKKSEEEDDKKWYFNLARDHLAYVSVYRKTVDEIEQYKKVLWSIVEDPDATNMEKIHAIRELHNLTKTHTLLLRDLPFVTNLSKYYNQDLINSNFHQQTNFQKTMEDEKSEREIIEQEVSERIRKTIRESGIYTLEQMRKMGIIESTNEEQKITDHVMEDMGKQLTMESKDILESINNKDYQETIRKIREIEEN
jgi:hypothetical protein